MSKASEVDFNHSMIKNLPHMKNIVILGATGSLGTQALRVIKKYMKEFRVIGISGFKNEKRLNEIAKKFEIPRENVILAKNDQSLMALTRLPSADIVINVISGTKGIAPTIEALKVGKTVLLGNKESLIAEGEKVMGLSGRLSCPKAAFKKVEICPYTFHPLLIPIDSEHSAITEILNKFPTKDVKRIIIPASGGPFLKKTKKELRAVTAKEALNHPKWKMGKKISIESATLINKGFEILEAHYLFKMPLSRIKAVVHPECRIHGMVEFKDGSVYAYFSKANMEHYIKNALFSAIKKPFPHDIRKIKMKDYDFLQIPKKTLPGIALVLKAFKRSKSSRNPSKKMFQFLQKEEKTIEKFLNGKITFEEIFTLDAK